MSENVLFGVPGAYVANRPLFTYGSSAEVASTVHAGHLDLQDRAKHVVWHHFYAKSAAAARDAREAARAAAAAAAGGGSSDGAGAVAAWVATGGEDPGGCYINCWPRGDGGDAAEGYAILYDHLGMFPAVRGIPLHLGFWGWAVLGAGGWVVAAVCAWGFVQGKWRQQANMRAASDGVCGIATAGRNGGGCVQVAVLGGHHQD